MKILAIGAHPDDIEIFMYGLLALCKKRGDEIFLAVATNGAAGTIINDKNVIKKRVYESKLALKSLGVPIMIGLEDGRLSEDKNAFKKIQNLISNILPDLIITHAPEDYHPDHRSLSKYISKVGGFKHPIIFADTLMGVNFKPEIYIDITEFYSEKIKSIKCHKSQNPLKFCNGVTLLNRFRSAQCNAPENNYAEAYRYDQKFPFTDLRSYLPNAPKYRPYYNINSDGFL